MHTEEKLVYELTRKRIKNINLRLRRDGTLAVSAPRWVSAAEIDRFVQSRAGWAARARARLAAAQERPAPPAPIELPVTLTDAECMAVFRPWLDRWAPVFAAAAGGEVQIRLKTLKSMWGVCRPARREITLNRRLAMQPAAAVEYVVLHEYLHFAHPDHGKAFHRDLDRLMPDNRARRALLRRPAAGRAG